jgi:IclR family pca regulon transcriptional regulator
MTEALDAARSAELPPAQPPAAWLRASKRELGPEFVESFARGLAVVTALDTASGGLTLSQVAEATGLPRATARRALITLQYLGYATQSDTLFRPTPRVLELGYAPLSALTLPQIAQPHLARLVEAVHESASMAVLADGDALYIARVPTVRIMSVAITVGTRFPAYATSLGRVLLADLPPAARATRIGDELPALTPLTVTSPERLAAVLDEVGQQGYALVDGELEEGLRSIAAPVRDASGRVVAAVNVSTHASRRTAEEAREELLEPLRAAVAAIEGDLAAASRFGRVAIA